MISESVISLMRQGGAPASTFGGRSQHLSSETFAEHLAEESSESKLRGETGVGIGLIPKGGGQTNGTGQVPASPVSGLQGLVPTGQANSQAVPPAAGWATATVDTPDDDYWASQPAPVQALRNIQDPTQREELATQLASEGYQIDVPIMVWGWDPVTTMQMRESYGYTWVPALGQQPLAAAPGIDFPDTNPYNPNNPPAGSIQVSVPT
jgi:hypothetical protein